MTYVHKILLVCVLTQWSEADGIPLFQGLSFQQGFEFNFKPWPTKPITFIKEIFSPLGVFEKKLIIQKRSLEDMMHRSPAAPVFEDIKEEPIGTAPLVIIPKAPVLAYVPKVPIPPAPLPKPAAIIVNDYPLPPVKPFAVPPISSNLVESIPEKNLGLYTDITKVQSVQQFIDSTKNLNSKPPEPLPIPTDLPISASPIPKPAITQNTVTQIVPNLPPILNISPKPVIPPPLSLPTSPKSPDLVHSGAPVPVLSKEEEKKEEAKKEEPPSSPPPAKHDVPKTDIVLKDNALIRGSKVALHFGTVFMSLMAQFFDKARTSLDLMISP